MKPQNLIHILMAIVCIGLLPGAKAVEPAAPDTALAGGNTADGQLALAGLTTGIYNSAFGIFSLLSNGTAKFNTGVGAGTLLVNTADENTATGAGALLNTTNGSNTANGAFALFSNTIGGFNTANGASALLSNTTGTGNAANGFQALTFNTAGSGNTADGVFALGNNTTGVFNTAIGHDAGGIQTTGSNNVYIGSGIPGVAGENNACYIASIFGQTSATGIPVLVGSDNKLGTTTSSKRFKEEIKPMDKASEALLALKPVTFRYKKNIDPQGILQFGLVAEDVEALNPDLVVRDKEGKPYTVRYEAVNAMLLNEFLKEHRKVGEQECRIHEQGATITQLKKDFGATIAQLTARLDEQAAQIQKVSAQLEASKPAPQVVNNP
jgi:hypothetical protein